MTMQQKLAQ